MQTNQSGILRGVRTASLRSRSAHGRAARLLVLAALVLCAGESFAQVPSGNLVQDPGFEPGTILHPFVGTTGSPLVPGDWNAEDATIITGPDAGISPRAGSGMLRMNKSGGTSGQVHQVIDVSAFAADIDAGNAVATFSIFANAPAANVSPSLFITAGATVDGTGAVQPLGGAVFIGFNRSLVVGNLDNDTATWEEIKGYLILPAGTRFIDFQMSEAVASIPVQGVFFYTASFTLSSTAPCVQQGFDIAPYGKFRILFIYAEIDYTGCTPPTGSPCWTGPGLPANVNDIIDPTFTPGSLPVNPLTDYFYQASFGKFIVLGDHLDHGHVGVERGT